MSQIIEVVDSFQEGLSRLLSAAAKRGILPWLIGSAIIAPMLMHPSAFAQSSRVVTIYDGERSASFPTDAATVKDALSKAGITVGEHDLIEPKVDTPILTDTFNINVFRARPVVVIDGDKRIETVSPYQSPKLIAEQAGLTVYPEDTFVLERINDFVGESALGLKLTVVRATKLELSLYGTIKDIRTQASTVGELLNQHGLEPTDGDIIRPKKDSKIRAGMTVYLVRVSGDTMVKEEPIPFSVREIRDKSKPLGYEDIQKAGQNGSKLVTYQIIYENGEEISRKVLSSVTVEQPVEQIVVVGNAYALADAFAALRQCESGGNYANKNNPLYRGAYQFLRQTWDTVAPSLYVGWDPADAPPSVQDQAALTLQQRSGWGQWPACASELGLL